VLSGPVVPLLSSSLHAAKANAVAAAATIAE
jgi:hypothetical protein